MDFSKTALGIELGSTRIKAVLIDEHHAPVGMGKPSGRIPWRTFTRESAPLTQIS